MRLRNRWILLKSGIMTDRHGENRPECFAPAEKGTSPISLVGALYDPFSTHLLNQSWMTWAELSKMIGAVCAECSNWKTMSVCHLTLRNLRITTIEAGNILIDTASGICLNCSKTSFNAKYERVVSDCYAVNTSIAVKIAFPSVSPSAFCEVGLCIYIICDRPEIWFGCEKRQI